MTVQNVNGVNKNPDKGIQKVSPKKAAPESAGKTQKASKPNSDSVEISKNSLPENVDSQKSDKLSLIDVVEISANKSKENEEQGLRSVMGEAAKEGDKVEISWRDPELVKRINELISYIKERRQVISERIEEARVLLMEKAYDDNHEIEKTADAILKGEDMDGLDLNNL
ncbi:MAG: hypothetical protein ABIK28_09400 [Planctomycetota bacterium]